MSVAAVSASDLNETCENDNIMPMEVNINQTYNSVNNATTPGTFQDLNSNILNLKQGDTYNFDRDYYYNSFADKNFVNGIEINTDSITLNVNHHKIDGKDLSAIFVVKANNVKIINMDLINSNAVRYSTNPEYGINTNGTGASISPITWIGDNGFISDCTFSKNTGLNGGAINWIGNNGVLNNITFLNNIALGVGGAIYVMGINTTIANTAFINSLSSLSGEAIYLDSKFKNLTVKDCTKLGGIFLTDGNKLGIDGDIFYKPVYVQIADKTVNIVDLTYLALINMRHSEISYIDDDLKYSIEKNGTDFFINFNRLFKKFDRHTTAECQKFWIDKKEFRNYRDILDYEGDLVFGKTFHLYNITSNKDIFNSLQNMDINGKNIEYTLIAEYQLKSIFELGSISYEPIFDYYKYIPEKYASLSRGVILNLPSNQTYHNPSGITIDAGKFSKLIHYDCIQINGNGCTMCGSFNPTEEKHPEVGFKLATAGTVLSISNIAIKGYNHGIFVDYGTCMLNNVYLSNNKMDYYIEKDYGAAILNLGVCVLNNCTFENNYAKYGPAIFNQGKLIFDNSSTFKNNHGYGLNADIFYTGTESCVIYNTELKIKAHYDSEREGYDVAPTGFAFRDNNGNSHSCVYKEGKSIGSRNCLITISCVISFVAGFFVGGFIGNPVAGAVAGLFVGAFIGSLFAYNIVSDTYDFNQNNLKTILICVGGSAAAGMVGGFIGGAVGSYLRAHSESYSSEINSGTRLDSQASLEAEASSEKSYSFVGTGSVYETPENADIIDESFMNELNRDDSFDFIIREINKYCNIELISD